MQENPKDRVESFHLTRVQLADVRGFRNLVLDLETAEGSPRPLTLVIGKNGTGKSTLLRAIAAGIAPIEEAGRMVGSPLAGLVRHGEAFGLIRSHFGSTRENSSRIVRVDRTHTGETLQLQAWPDWNLFLCGYGAGRYGTKTEQSPGYRASAAVSSLFRYEQALLDPELTLYRLKSVFGSEIYDRTLLGLKRALGLRAEDDIGPRKGGGIEVSGPSVGGTIPFEAWADGYRLTFSWILDLYGWAMQAEAIDEDGHVQGILLIDEIEQHLHPSMQAEILPRLSELLPRMQIFATTHSPLVALDAKPEELVVLRREGDEVVAEQNVPDFAGYSVEDMLADPRLFDSEVYGGDMRLKLSRYRELAAVPRPERSAQTRGELRSLATELRSIERPVAAENETSRLLKELVAKYDL